MIPYQFCILQLLLGILLRPSSLVTCQNVGDTEVVYSWITIDYAWASDEDREEAIANGTYIPENCVASGVKTFNDEMYLSSPRFRPGVPATMTKVVVIDGEPLLQPYPSWEMQEPDDCDALQFSQSMEIDPNTGYMWTIDTGRRETATPEPVNACPAKLVIFDLVNNQTVDFYEFPEDVVSRDANYLNDIVIDPVAGFAYMSDAGYGPSGFYGGIVVYNQNERTSHRIEDRSMLPEFGAGQMEIGGEMYSFVIPVNGIALSPDKSQLHYSAIAGFSLYQLPTEIAQQPDVANISSYVRFVGEKISQSDGIVMGVNNLYYGALSGVFDSSAVYWPYAMEMEEQDAELDEVVMTEFVVQYENYTVLEWPDALSIDDEGWLYAISVRANKFVTGTMDFTGGDGANFNVVRIFVDDQSYLSVQ